MQANTQMELDPDFIVNFMPLQPFPVKIILHTDW